MELLVVTLVHTHPQREVDAGVRMRLIADTIRHAPGLMNLNLYRGRGRASHFLMLTTWSSEETWRESHEQHNPRHLLLNSAPELLMTPPEQWLMHYLWGYTRPAANPVSVAAHLAFIRPEQAELAQQGWIEALRRQARFPLLAFAFLARGEQEDPAGAALSAPTEAPPESARAEPPRGNVFLNLLSWANSTDREDFYADTTYQAINRFIGTLGTTQVLSLEPL
jgi:quinol monooxygenase YgiN